jgi:dipeptidyl aminopeptidase/acylaminoacyl peptidase
MNSAGVYYYNLDSRVVRPLYRHKGKYGQLSIDEEGRRVAFLADIDTTKARIRPWQLVAWTGLDGDTASVRKVPERVLDSGYRVSDLGTLRFSADGEALYLGVAPAPVLPDTSLLPEEIVQVEVWAWSDQRLYTEQEARMDRDKKQTFPLVWHIDSDRFVVLGDSAMPELRFDEDRVASMALGYTEEPYARYITWEGAAHKDVFAVDIRTGERVRIVHDLRCDPYLSPGGRYIYWWSDPDTAWYCWGAKKREVRRLTGNNQVRFGDEETDVPDFPNAYGVAGWMDADKRILIYDRYDIWSIDPEGIRPAHRLTVGREEGIRYRYIRLDPDLKSIPRGKILLHGFHERTKSESYSWLDLDSGFLTRWQSGDYAYNRQVLKAGESASMVFTRENFTEFPDLRYVNGPEAAAAIVISKANPQQEGYFWGSVELVYWTSLTGDSLTGMLVKPEGFDASKKYPMLVYFYERMTDELNRHRAPDFGRSSINWTFYASRGYLVFIPDIRYRTGYPGGSAYDAVMSGTTAMIERGFVDKSRVGVQGHSWGGYQTAYLITRTDLFVCAESGAPVVNMTSAYGGIRWESGLSRAFQYERQQSRIGGSLWEYPLRYLENSPLFTLDKVKTPVLILHNDKDGAVPWQQGIEFYSALRRLGKPCWLLNYNDEPHWPVKLQNRIDFQTRMQQFFDYYLLGSPKPRWMERGVPPMEKGILQGLETNRK